MPNNSFKLNTHFLLYDSILNLNTDGYTFWCYRHYRKIVKMYLVRDSLRRRDALPSTMHIWSAVFSSYVLFVADPRPIDTHHAHNSDLHSKRLAHFRNAWLHTKTRQTSNQPVPTNNHTDGNCYTIATRLGRGKSITAMKPVRKTEVYEQLFICVYAF